MADPNELLPVGKIIGTHGIKGLLKVFSYSGNIQSLHAAKIVFMKGKDGVLREYGITRVSPHSSGFILGLDDFSDINQVLPLVGSELCLERSQLPVPDEDEYYWCDLLGLSVQTDTGTTLGTIVDIFETGSSDIYVVRGEQKEYLIPAIADVIDSIDLPGKKMVITPLDGLLDL
ncbi:MAG: ribosome maturation factor RimM [Desulfuromonadaceae bacterium]|nr:ribosome maturation factor RimM [Desulfuromonadaceae bacterium]MDD5106787.1 ribosome maturation factor RimM [Desulfuromonadaceae bacterium]